MIVTGSVSDKAAGNGGLHMQPLAIAAVGGAISMAWLTIELQ